MKIRHEAEIKFKCSKCGRLMSNPEVITAVSWLVPVCVACACKYIVECGESISTAGTKDSE